MALVSEPRYRSITLDESTADYLVTARLEDAQELIEGALSGRLLEEAERVETLPISSDWRVFPHATPITAVPVDSVYAIDGSSLVNVAADASTLFWPHGWADCRRVYATVTYTGGWTQATVPAKLAYSIAQLAEALGRPGALPVGARSVSLGDAAITYDRPLEGLDEYVPGLARKLRGYRYVDLLT